MNLYECATGLEPILVCYPFATSIEREAYVQSLYRHFGAVDAEHWKEVCITLVARLDRKQQPQAKTFQGCLEELAQRQHKHQQQPLAATPSLISMAEQLTPSGAACVMQAVERRVVEYPPEVLSIIVAKLAPEAK